jgi:hypothetical protein
MKPDTTNSFLTVQGRQLTMHSILAWIDHDTKARDRALRILSLFLTKENRNELGLGSIRDHFADKLFPGTSTIQTRLRYMLFVPWIYRSLEDKRVPAGIFAKKADRIEKNLIDSLMASDDQAGVIAKAAGKSIKRLPSSVYWAGLGDWGIRRYEFSQSTYLMNVHETYALCDKLNARKKAAIAIGDDVDNDMVMQHNWHSRLPKPPEDFPERANFALTKDEADFILDCLCESFSESLLYYLASKGKPTDTKTPWEHPDYQNFSKDNKELLTHARLFSEVTYGASLSYYFQLATLRKLDNKIAEYQANFDQWAAKLPFDEIETWSLERLRELLPDSGRNDRLTKEFVKQWIGFILKYRKNINKLLSESDALKLIENREKSLKGHRSRFKNDKALEQWNRTTEIEKFSYRWPNVKVLLNDLYQGLNRAPMR